jgi:sugar (pentulose or hexulose) kinase
LTSILEIWLRQNCYNQGKQCPNERLKNLMTTKLLSLDLGTTHTKAGLFAEDGHIHKTASRKIVAHQGPSASTYFDPGELWAAVVELIREITQGTHPGEIAAIGITSMAETGLLIDNQTGEPRTQLIPWFDDSAATQVRLLEAVDDPQERFCRTGIRPNFKSSLAKILWLRQENPELLQAATWLSTADFIAYKLSGEISTDYSLAGRTYAFNINSNTWDSEWLQAFHLPPELFPPAVESGHPIGILTQEAGSSTGLSPGIPIAISGHDHVCAAFAILGDERGKVFDSMGTAEALIGILDKDKLGVEEYDSGLVFGRYVSGNGFYWMGGMSASGGSLEWVRSILGDPALSYAQMEAILSNASPGPSGIIYFPYLSGSGSPHTDIYARGAFVGLKTTHQRADLVKAILEGTAFEAEFIRQAAEKFLGVGISSIAASGGGTRIQDWMQIKADVFGCPIEVHSTSEASLLGATLLAGLGIGLYPDANSAISAVQRIPECFYQFRESYHRVYHDLYQQGFIPLQNPLRDVYRNIDQK